MQGLFCINTCFSFTVFLLAPILLSHAPGPGSWICSLIIPKCPKVGEEQRVITQGSVDINCIRMMKQDQDISRLWRPQWQRKRAGCSVEQMIGTDSGLGRNFLSGRAADKVVKHEIKGLPRHPCTFRCCQTSWDVCFSLVSEHPFSKPMPTPSNVVLPVLISTGSNQPVSAPTMQSSALMKTAAAVVLSVWLCCRAWQESNKEASDAPVRDDLWFLSRKSFTEWQALDSVQGVANWNLN